MLCLYEEWHQLQVWIKGLFSQDTTSCIPDTSDLYPVFPNDPPKQGDTCSRCNMEATDLHDIYVCLKPDNLRLKG